MNRLRTTSKPTGARRKPIADPTPAPRGINTRADAELLRQPRRMQRRAAAEGDQRAPGEVLAALHRVHARGIRHRLLDHFADAERRGHRVETERGADIALQRRLRACSGCSRMRPPAKPVGIDAAKHKIGIGHRRRRRRRRP